VKGKRVAFIIQLTFETILIAVLYLKKNRPNIFHI
jgi:hypothetical protein